MTRTHLPIQRAQEDLAKIDSKQNSGAQDKSPAQDGHSDVLHRWMMTFCLVAMGGAMLFVLWRGQTLGGGTWLLVLPMLLCLGIHFLMHRRGHRHSHRHGDD
ncbi:DUF2933 domain-containing protein [Billgrantia montanilacus]|uniref:DUF2933 domain-containing protein n=1 Tax=Billgrantia montanilacus TaxID=2282305 RepID=A0A368TY12_9GAMM|nr:DUF2933 domain-containing protein [Halomonas montanilacus]RCV89640.1 DUF2933 domain-containing protein [Halomonas montanilacus]